MKTILLLLLCSFALPPVIVAQKGVPPFNRTYYTCENQWVMLPGNAADSTYSYGFVYLDRDAGFTYDHGGSLKITVEEKYTVQPLEGKSIKHRLEPNTVLMAVLPADKVTEMGLPATPEWLAQYRNGENTVRGQVKRGFHYNHVGASEQAIPILLETYAKEPHAENLEFELSYAYNATKQPHKAIEVLKLALDYNPSDFMFLRELGYAYMLQNNTVEAEKIYKKGILLSTDKTQQAEMAYNTAGIYYREKNKKKFKEWAAKVREFAAEDSVYYTNLVLMEKDFNKQ